MAILHDYEHLNDTRTRRRGGVLTSCINGSLDRSDDGGHCIGQDR